MGSRFLLSALVVSLLLLAVSLAWTPISNNDIWLHLKTGSLILDRGAVPREEEYTYTRAGAPLVDHEWLSQALFAFVYRIGGLGGLAFLKTLLTSATLAVIFREGSRAAPGQESASLATRLTAAAVGTTGAALLVASHLFIRPHLFTFLLAACFASILPRLGSEERGARWRALAALAGLQLAWANLHGGFVVGILLAATHAAGQAISRRKLVPEIGLPLLLAAVSLVNPYGWRIYALVGEFTDPAFHRMIVEWKSPFTDPFAMTPLFWVYLLWLALSIAAAAAALVRGEAASALSTLIFGALSMSSRRHVSLFGVITGPMVGRASASALARLGLRGRAAPAVAWGTAASIAALSGTLGVFGLPWERGEFRRPGTGIAENVPVEALEVVRSEGLKGRVWNSLAFGAYVTWAGWPELRTAIDSRLEVFGGEFLSSYERALRSSEAFEGMERRAPFDIALLQWQRDSVRGATLALAADPGWALIYFDDVAVLYLRRAPETSGILARRAFTLIDPARFTAGAGLAEGSDLSGMEREARRAVSSPPSLPGRPPMNAVARTILGSILQREERHAEAAAELEAAVTARPNDVVAWGLLGVSLVRTGDYDGARAAFTELKRRVPGSVFAARMLDELPKKRAR